MKKKKLKKKIKIKPKKVKAKKVAKKVAPKKEKKEIPAKVKKAKPLTAREVAEQKIEALVKKGQDRGFVTYAEIMQELPTIETDIKMLESLYQRFEDKQVEVLETREFLDIPEEGKPEVKG